LLNFYTRLITAAAEADNIGTEIAGINACSTQLCDAAIEKPL
jgi:hypothetical protein